MQVQYHKVLFELTFWLITEVILNLVGLDVLANYSEFIFTKDSRKIISCPQELAVTIPPSCRWIIGLHSA